MSDRSPPVKLGDLVTLVKGISYRSEDLSASDGVPFLNLRNVKRGGGFRPDGTKRFTGTVREKVVVQPGDLLIALTDLTREMAVVGSPLQVPDSDDLAGATYSLDLARILVRSAERVQPDYLALVLQGPAARAYMQSVSTGTTVLHLNVEAALRFPVVLPTLQAQRRIVDLVASVDQAADASRLCASRASELRSGLLSELLSRPASSDETLPAGWREATLGDVADYLNGYPFKPADLVTEGLPVIRIKQLLDPSEAPDRSTVEVDERHHLRNGNLIFSWSGTLAVRVWDRGPAILNQHLFKVVEREGIDRTWLRFALDHAITDLNTKTHGTTMKHITKAKMMPHPVIIPPPSEQRRIANMMVSIDQTIEAHASQAERAVSLRSNLLADLLSGSHEIPETYDRFLEEAS